MQTVRYAYWSKSNRIQCVDADNSGGCSGSGDESIWLYDAYGNLILDPSRAGETTPIVGRYVYDAANRLVEICSDWSSSTSYSTGTCQGIITTYQYNGDGDRVSQTVGGITTTYVIDPASSLTNVLSETTSGQTTNYLYGLDLVGQKAGANTRYFEYDGLGSVRQLTDGTGAIQLTQTFDPYGNGYAKSGTAASSFGYTGEQTDANGFVYLRARYYQPGMGRFFGADPSRQETNLYQYAGSNPVMYSDPSGKCINGANYVSHMVLSLFTPRNDIVADAKYLSSLIDECERNLSVFTAVSDDPNADLGDKAAAFTFHVIPGGVATKDSLVETYHFDQVNSRWVGGGEYGRWLGSGWFGQWLGWGHDTSTYYQDPEHPWRYVEDFGSLFPTYYNIGLTTFGVGQAGINGLTSATWKSMDPGIRGLTLDEGAGLVRVPNSIVISNELAIQQALNEAAELGIKMYSDDETIAYLNWRSRQQGTRVNAATFGNTILIRPEYARNVAVLRQEMIHSGQQMTGQATTGNIAEMEIQARMIILQNRHTWGITREEALMIIQQIRQIIELGGY